MQEHEYYMKLALEEAQKAYDIGEVPVGAVMVYQEQVIARSFNKKETENNSVSHAEILLISETSKILKNWRLNECSLYITLEPCPMCAGAIIQSRISTVIYGAPNLIYGSFGTVLPLQNYYPDSKSLKIISGIREKESSELMKNFFRRELPKING